jgi:ABC-type multidrug transport system ATPase subunit
VIASNPGSVSIVAEGLTKRYAGRAVFSSLTFEIAPGQITALLGPNGSGKSTLLKMIAKLLEPSKGKCEWMTDGKPVKTDTPENLRGYVAPYLELYDDLTALEHVQFVARVKHVALNSEAGIALLHRFGLADDPSVMARRLRAFSSGMRQRVRLAMAAVGDPALLFLDEPTSNLDAKGIDLLFQFLGERERAGSTIILATNEPREIELASSTIEITRNGVVSPA